MGRPLHAARPAPRRTALATVVAIAAVLLLPAIAAAHPLGNFTINHYAEVRVEADRVLLDVVIDQAEIPAFQARQGFDLDGDGSVSDDEIDAGRVAGCRTIASTIELTAGGAPLQPVALEAGLSFPPGVGGLSTMRQVCAFEAKLPAPIADAAVEIGYADRSFPERIGWREIVAHGSGVTLDAVEGELRDASVSHRLTTYPADLISTPLADARLLVRATSGGAQLVAFDVPDAEPVPGARPAPAASPIASSAPGLTAVPVPNTGAVPGGVGGTELPSIFRQDLTPIVILVSLLTAAALGAGHALTPGHGKTLMAAYLVGTRGTGLHALGLGLSVSISHTVGILVLAGVVVGFSDVLAPDVVVRWAPIVAALSIALIGGWMLLTELRRRRGVGSRGAEHAHDHAHGDGHDHAHGHAHPHADGDGLAHPHAAADAHEDRQPAPAAVQSDGLAHSHAPAPTAVHSHGVAHSYAHAPTAVHSHAPAPTAVHSHGGIAHSHAPAPGSTITWRSLFLLGLAGGLIPSTSALLILLGSIAAGRPAFGFILVVAFGLGMAAVMGGIGFALVAARDRVERVELGAGLARLRETVPLLASVIVLSFGLFLTAQALGGTLTL